MTSKELACEAKHGIEALDLASLLCRFEEATSSVNDFVCWNKGSKIIQGRISGNTPMSSPANRSVRLETKNEIGGVPASDFAMKSTFSNSDFIELPEIQAELVARTTPASSLNSDLSLVSVEIDSSKAKSKLENSSTFLSERFEQSGNSIMSGTLKPYSIMHTSKVSSPMVGFASQETVVESDNIISLNHSQELEPNVTYACEATGISLSSPKLEQSQLLCHNAIIFGKTAMSENTSSRLCQQELDLKDYNFHYMMEPCPETEKYKLLPSPSQSGMHDFENRHFFICSDHNYCLNKMQTLQRISECPKEALQNNASSRNAQLQDSAIIFENCAPSLCPDVSCDSKSLFNSNCAEESIFEVSQVSVDANGNDLYYSYEHQLTEMFECDSSSINNESTIKTFEKKESRKRTHNCLRNTEYNNGPLCKDESVFFDKIPAYYTTLSIPSKPVTTTVFASTTKAIGSTDHLEFLDSSEPCSNGHYDRVPAHRRCFTNTTKEVEIKLENSESQNLVYSHMPKQLSFPNLSLDESYNLSSSVKSLVSDVENPAAKDVNCASTSHSPHSISQGRRSRSTTRRSGSISCVSRRSASSDSDCSTCSSCSNSSSCSTCSVMSRASSTSGSEKDYSLSSDYQRIRCRSRSPDFSRGSGLSPKKPRYSSTSSKTQSRSRGHSPLVESGWRSKCHANRVLQNSPVKHRSEKRRIKEEEQIKAMEERRVVYVGKIPNGYTKRQLYKRFQCFGEIKEVKVNFREHGDNYGFVTFAYACDAIAAKEKGNSNPGEVKFDLCFGGRRHFCPDQYSDLDGNREIEEEYAPMSRNLTQELDYAALLKMHTTQQKKQ